MFDMGKEKAHLSEPAVQLLCYLLMLLVGYYASEGEPMLKIAIIVVSIITAIACFLFVLLATFIVKAIILSDGHSTPKR